MKEEKDIIYFINNKLFIKWRLTQSEELDLYWHKYLIAHPEDSETINIAIEKCKSVRLNDRKLSDNQIEDLWASIVFDVEQKTKSSKLKRRIITVFSIAAFIAVLLISMLLFHYLKPTPNYVTAETIVGEKLPDENILLSIGNKVITLNPDAHLVVDNDNKILIEENDQKREETLSDITTINKLFVPYGKRTTLILNDGTKVWLNSGTELQFPSRFGFGTREIATKGEIYIEVVEDTARPFLVHTPDFDVKVHGTKFNVFAYESSAEKSVVLVDGKVEVKTSKNESIFLAPNEKVSINSGQVNKSNVNPKEYISWKDNILLLDHVAISDILKIIERYYNFSFETSGNASLLQKTCTGKLLLSDNIDDIMNALSVLSSTTYKRENNRIYITNKN